MKNAVKQDSGKSLSKSKGKATLSLSKTFVDAGPSNAKGKAKAEPELKKVSLKDRMRRKEKPKPEVPTKFVPMIFDEDEDQESESDLKPKTPPVSEPEERLLFPSVEEARPQDEPREPTPLQGEPLVAGPSSVQEPKETTPTETRVVAESVPQPQAMSPISSITSLSDSEPEPIDPQTLEQEVVPSLPTANGSAALDQLEQTAPEPAPTEGTSRAEILPIVDVPSEPQLVQEPPLVPQAAQESQPAPQVGDDPAPTGQPTLPAKPKPGPRKRRQSSIPTSTRITRSAFKPPPPVVKPPATRRKLSLAFTLNLC